MNKSKTYVCFYTRVSELIQNTTTTVVRHISINVPNDFSTVFAAASATPSKGTMCEWCVCGVLFARQQKIETKINNCFYVE